MSQDLYGKKVAILATNGFEETELTDPLRALKEAGATVEVIAPQAGAIQGMRHKENGRQVQVDSVVSDVDADDYAALVLPGGVANPDELRMNPRAVAFVKRFFEAGKPVAAICHGPWTLIEAEVVRGRTMTSWPSLRTDLKNAGANWVDREVIVDRGLVTSRKPDDLPAFCRAMVEAFSESRPTAGRAAE